MPSQPVIQNELTLRAAIAGPGINLFAGAGFSVLANDKHGRSLPVGNTLKDELLAFFRMVDAKRLDLAQVCAMLEATQADAFRSFLKARFSVVTFDSRYEAIWSLPIKTIFTTNIDDLFFRIYEKSDTHYLNDIDITGPAFGDRSAVDYIALHGSVTHSSSNFVFNPMELATAFSSDPDKWRVLTQRLQRFPTVFWGYGLADAGVLQALSPASVKGRLHQDKWIVLREPDEGTKAYFSALGFNIIASDSSQFLSWLNSLPHPVAGTEVGTFSTQKLFPEHSIPNPSSVPVRPIRDFYCGAPPTWHDIFSNRVPRTSHYAHVIEAINSGRSVVVLGMPTCGKSTLLMQVAAAVPFDGHKLVCASLTVEKAALIRKQLGGQRALIFLDDFADSVQAFECLRACANVQIVGIDRDYYFERISHLVPNSAVRIVEVTNLTDIDVQTIFSAIPQELRYSRLIRPVTEEGVPPSIYELVESNMIAPALSERFVAVLADLDKRNRVLHDFLIMCCYVHCCRTPVSFDMAFAFLRDTIDRFEEVYGIVSDLNSLVFESSATVVETDQDYFVPRSVIVSEAIVNNVQPAAFRRVLTRFHNEVSPYRIARFDAFRRKGYDERFVTRAFTDWKDGELFYEMLCVRDPSPYLRQQAALYLAHKRHFKEAFKWIDEAIEASGNRIPSIRNTHAIILFKANISVPDFGSELVAGTLKRSMDILAECYKYDKRKGYHALTFADQAVQYWQVYGDSLAKSYLETAKKWLIEESKRSPWHRGVKRLLRSVEKELGT
ncbi:MAG: hypothetical protein JWQ87_3222 [Candidatus Sulfotelmatobacter sp.]|nr:hypothetical protein [Candidatus Sulfotelmatobacter sp.]